MNILQNFKANKANCNFPELYSKLSEFGLCPNDWELSLLNDFTFKIQNKHEPSFYFIGKAEYKKGVSSWALIQLASL